MDVLGNPIDERGPVEPDAHRVDPPQGAGLRRAEPVAGTARNRHQGDRPDLPVRQGRQGRPVRRRRRRQDRQHDGADQQHRQGALRPVGVRRRRRAHPRGQRLLSRDDGVGRRQPREPRRVEGGDGLRPDERAAGQPPARRADRPDDRRDRSATKAATCCSSSTTSTATRWPAPKCRRCWAACRRRWATSRRWPRRWAACRSASRRPRSARSRRSRPCTCRPTT